MIKTKKFKFTIYFLFLMSCFNSVSGDTNTGNVIPYWYLEESYKTGNTELLEQFLQDWHDRYDPISEQEWNALPPAAQAAYQIYQKYFFPHSDDRFVMVQNKLHIIVRDNFEKVTGKYQEKWQIVSRQLPLFEFELKDIQPRQATSNNKILYVNDYYEGLLFSFLDT